VSATDLRGYRAIWIRYSIVTPLIFATIAIVISLPALFISLQSGDLLGIAASTFFLAIAALFTVRSLQAYAKNAALKELAEGLSSYGVSILSGSRAEVGTIRIEGRYIQTVRGHSTYQTTYKFEKLGEAFAGLGLSYISQKGGLILINNMGEGILYGHCIKVTEGRYKGAMIIPIQPSLPAKRVEERLDGGGDSAIFSLELGGCVVKGYIAVLSRSKARSYRVELRSSVRGLSTRIYSGDAGPFEYSYPCTPIAIVLWRGAIDMKQIASRVREALGISGREFFIGYESGALRLALVIDIPMARDISKEIPL